ncbi:uncharacterized protein ACA1_003640, partial [Acanthamoeba castellanii str. Neff]
WQPPQSSFTLRDGSRWLGDLYSSSSCFTSEGEGTLSLPNGLEKQCILQTGHGRNVHLWTEDGSEKYVLSLETGALAPTDEFKYEQHADDDDDDDADVEEHTDTTMSATTSI